MSGSTPGPTTLVLISGGIASAARLVQLLREGSGHLLAHHVEFIATGRDHAADRRAADALVAHCRAHLGTVAYSTSRIDRRRLARPGPPALSAAFEGALAARSYFLATGQRVDRWCIGGSGDNLPGGQAAADRLVAAMAAASYPEAAPVYHPLPAVPHAEAEQLFGPELLALMTG